MHHFTSKRRFAAAIAATTGAMLIAMSGTARATIILETAVDRFLPLDKPYEL